MFQKTHPTIKCLQFAFAFPCIQEILSSGQNFAAISTCALASCLQFESCCTAPVREESTGCLQRLKPWLLSSRFGTGQLWLTLGRCLFVLKPATDLSLKVSYSVPWTAASILNETGFGAALNYAMWTALARTHGATLWPYISAGRESDGDFQKPGHGPTIEVEPALKDWGIN